MFVLHPRTLENTLQHSEATFWQTINRYLSFRSYHEGDHFLVTHSIQSPTHIHTGDGSLKRDKYATKYFTKFHCFSKKL